MNNSYLSCEIVTCLNCTRIAKGLNFPFILGTVFPCIFVLTLKILIGQKRQLPSLNVFG